MIFSDHEMQFFITVKYLMKPLLYSLFIQMLPEWWCFVLTKFYCGSIYNNYLIEKIFFTFDNNQIV